MGPESGDLSMGSLLPDSVVQALNLEIDENMEVSGKTNH